MAVLLVLLSGWAAALAARIGGPDRWLYQLDLPKIDLPLAIFYAQALRDGGLPLWNDRLGLGFPLYAEGQIGAFYPPYWLIFRLDPLVALDVVRVLHLVLAGVGTGLIVLRLSGSRTGAVVAAVTAALCGGIVTKLEWTNMVAAYGWAPWVLLPLVRAPLRWSALAASGVAWGIQALCGHPNTWVLTGLAATTVLIAVAPRPRTLARVALFGAVGLAVGAVQLIPLLLLASLSARSQGLSAVDLFSAAMKPFDPLAFAFAGAFLRTGQDGAWDLFTNWYPNGSFALLEAWAYVGIPLLALATVGWRARRGRALRVLLLVLLAIPFIAAFRPELWTKIPLLNGMRSPSRAYLFVDLVMAILAGVAFARLRHERHAARVATIVALAAAAAYGVIALTAVSLPATFEGLLLDLSAPTNLQRAGAPAARALAVAALVRPWPLVLELALAASFGVLLWWTARHGRASRWPLAALALVPLILFTPSVNPVRGRGEFTFAGNDIHPTLLALAPRRILTIDEPGWYPGMPDQLAAAGIPDVRMFSSLDLAASDALLDQLRHDADAATLRRLVGIDTVVTFKTSCPGTLRAHTKSDDAFICAVESFAPPYWVPATAARVTRASDAAWRPTEASIDAGIAAREAVPGQIDRRTTTEAVFRIDAPSDGWVYVDRAWWPAWTTTVDDRPVSVARALAGQLVPVSAGKHVVSQRLVPLEALGGAALGLVVIGTIGALWWRRRASA